MFTLTDRPYETMWSHLRLLSHESNARRLLQGELSGGRRQCPAPVAVLEAKARQVAYCIVQAFEYYKAADAVTIDTSPLLYFYGMLSLSKALIVANEPGTLLDDIKYHGLGRSDKSSPSSGLEDQSAKANEGVFARLTSVVQEFVYDRGATFTFKDVLSISPELYEIYERYFRTPSRCLIRHFRRVLSQEPYTLELCVVAPSPDYVYQRIPELEYDFDLRAAAHGGQAAWFRWFNSKPSAQKPPSNFWEYNPPAGGEFFVGALPFFLDGRPSKRYLYPPLSDYIGMFILSDCVRYKQDLWRDVVLGRETGMLGLVDLFIDVSRRRFPNLILTQLFKEPFEYEPKRRVEPTTFGTTYWPKPG